MTRPTRSRQLLARIVDEPHLVAAVRSADPGVLCRLIEHVGLEDAGEIVALTSTAQLERIFEEDLWRSERPGEDEEFDAERFALWLEILLEVGEGFAARKLTDLDEDLLTLALGKQLLVIDHDALIRRLSDSRRSVEDDLLDKALESSLSLDFEEFLLVARSVEGWDALIAVLLEIDREDHALLRRLLERCCFLTTEHIEDNGGLYNVLTSAEMLEGDLAAVREDRREERGHVAPSTARSFLRLASETPLDEIVGARTADPITRSHFRSFRSAVATASAAPGGKVSDADSADDREPSAPLLDALRDAGVLTPAVGAPLLERGRDREPEPLLTEAIRAIKLEDPDLYERCTRELAYLANVLVSGHAVEQRRYRPLEALQAAIAVCDRGLTHLLGAEAAARSPAAAARATTLIEREDLVKLFRIGWHLEHAASAPSRSGDRGHD